MKELPEEVKKIHSQRINALMTYYSISNIAAEYIYFRRKRGFPWKKREDPKYIEWSNKLLNALREADKIFGFDWSGLTFGNEGSYLENYGIILDEMSEDVEYKDYPRDWISSSNKKKILVILRKIGILPKKNFPNIHNKLLEDRYK